MSFSCGAYVVVQDGGEAVVPPHGCPDDERSDADFPLLHEQAGPDKVTP